MKVKNETESKGGRIRRLTPVEVILGINTPLMDKPKYTYEDFEIINFDTQESIWNTYPDGDRKELLKRYYEEPQWRTGVRYKFYENVIDTDETFKTGETVWKRSKKAPLIRIRRRSEQAINTFDDPKLNRNWRYLIVDTTVLKRYLINENGVIYSVKKRCILTRRINSKGYSTVNISLNNKQKTKYVHRLLLNSFRGEGYGKDRVTFLDGDRTNITLDNLLVIEWKQK